MLTGVIGVPSHKQHGLSRLVCPRKAELNCYGPCVSLVGELCDKEKSEDLDMST
jgi:hypothetical protein